MGGRGRDPDTRNLESRDRHQSVLVALLRYNSALLNESS